MIRIFLTLLIFLAVLPIQAKTDNDFQNWSLITVNKKLADKWSAYFEVQNRLGDDIHKEGLLFIRPALRYHLNKHSSVWQGYAWVPNFISGNLVNENRIWQQIDYKTKYKKLDLFAWMRLEERFLEGTDTISLRHRTRLGFKYPLFKLQTWKFVAFDEFFFNFYSVDNGPKSGFDQNWAFVGFEKKFSDTISLNFGYLANYLDRDVNQLQHALRVHMNVNI